MKASDHFSSVKELGDLLSEAEVNAKNDWEAEFIESLTEKFEQYGLNMFMSASQFTTLERIAGGG